MLRGPIDSLLRINLSSFAVISMIYTYIVEEEVNEYSVIDFFFFFKYGLLICAHWESRKQLNYNYRN